MMKKIAFSLLAFLMLVTLPLSAAKQPAFFYQWQKLSDKKLIMMGNEYTSKYNAPDSALACFTIVTNRNGDKTTKEECWPCETGLFARRNRHFRKAK